VQLTVQANGKIERYHRTIKSDCIRPGTPLSLEDARRLVEEFVRQYNESRLHSAIGYVTPLDKLLGRELAIFAARDRKLEEARRKRQENRARRRAGNSWYTTDAWTEDRTTVGTEPSAVPGPEARPGGLTPPCFPSPNLSLLAQSDKSQGAWGTASPT